MSGAEYSDAVDPVIRSPRCLKFSKRDWLELAIAAADQAGASVQDQADMRATLEARIELTEVVR